MPLLRRTLLCLVVGVTAVALYVLMLASVRFPPGGFDPVAAAELQQEGDAIVAGLEDYRRANGAYPTALVTRPPLGRRYGGWQYETRGDGKACDLRVGDYGRHGFVLVWSSEANCT